MIPLQLILEREGVAPRAYARGGGDPRQARTGVSPRVKVLMEDAGRKQEERSEENNDFPLQLILEREGVGSAGLCPWRGRREPQGK
jgi:hypothetical protein